MTLNQIEYFYKAATMQHFNKAAEALNISQPSLSRSMAALESELGVILFEKQGRNVVLTKAGKIFLQHTKEILETVRRAEKNMNEIATGGGEIRLAYLSPLSATFIPKMAHSFLNEGHKDIRFRFYEGDTRENIDGLKKGRYDLIFCANRENEPDIDFFPLLQHKMVVILPEYNQQAEQTELGVDIFTHYPVIGYERGTALGRETREFFRNNGITPDITCELPDEHGIAALVAEGFGIALVADVEAVRNQKGIAIRPLTPELSYDHHIYLACIKNQYRLPAVSELIQYMQKNKEELQASFLGKNI